MDRVGATLRCSTDKKPLRRVIYGTVTGLRYGPTVTQTLRPYGGKLTHSAAQRLFLDSGRGPGRGGRCYRTHGTGTVLISSCWSRRKLKVLTDHMQAVPVR